MKLQSEVKIVSAKNESIQKAIPVSEKFKDLFKDRWKIPRDKIGNSFTMEAYLEFLLNLETPERLREFMQKSIKGTSRYKLYMSRFFEENKGASEDDWHDFHMSPEFQKFKKANQNILKI